MSKVRYVYRSAITGKFVSKEYAEQHRDTTVRHEYEVEDKE